MTAPAAAPASGPVAPPVQRASPHPPTIASPSPPCSTRFLPHRRKRARRRRARRPPRNSRILRKSRATDSSSSRQSARHSLLSDGGLLAALPFALSAASAMDEGSQAAGHASSLAPAAAKASGAEAGGAPAAASDRSTGRTARWRTRLSLRRLRLTARLRAAGWPARRRSRWPTPCQDLAPQVNRSGESAVAAGFASAGRAAMRRRNQARRRSIERQRAGPGVDRSPRSRTRNKSREPHASGGARGGAKRTQA